MQNTSLKHVNSKFRTRKVSKTDRKSENGVKMFYLFASFKGELFDL